MVPPAAAGVEESRQFALAGRQSLLVERMTNSALLAALDVDAPPRLEAAHWSRDRFEQTQGALRDADPSGRQDAAARPAIGTALDRVGQRWRAYEAAFDEFVASPAVTSRQIAALARSHEALSDDLREMVNGYEHYAHGGRNHSILAPMIESAGDLRAGTQQVLRGLLMVAHAPDSPQDRQRLSALTAEFDSRLNGLLRGDPDHLLLPAPTPDIRAQLQRVDLIWNDTKPILEAASASGTVETDEIVAVAEHASAMAVPLTLALIMYLSL